MIRLFGNGFRTMGRGFSTQKKVSKKALALWLIVPPFLYTMHGVYRDGFGSLFRKMKDPLVPLKKPEEPEYQGEYDVFKTAADLKNGEKRAFQVGPKEEDAVLIIKQDDKYYCVQDKCPHFGFSLAKGSLFGQKIVCPLHNATFDIKTGLNETGPVFDGLQTYKITEKEGVLKIEIPKGALNKGKTFPMAKKTYEGNPVVVIGGGPAALSAIETLRQAGFQGSITMISKQEALPYDRTALSKNLKANPDGTAVRKQDFYSTYGIDLIRGRAVKSVNYDKKQLVLNDGRTVDYENLLIATGASPVIPKIPGASNVPQLVLRNHSDLEKIRQHITPTTKNITIIGAGFIGLQLSSSLKLEYKNAVNVTLVQTGKTPLQRVFGPEVGSSLQSLAEKNGVKFETSATIKQIKAENAKPVSVELANKSIPSDLVIFATGVRPETEFLGNIDRDGFNGGVRTDAYLHTNRNGVYAAGDVASYPYWLTGGHVRIEHYNQAIYEGSVAALNMLGKKVPMDNVPFFWTRAFNNSVQYSGTTQGYDDLHIAGDLASQKFIAYYFRNGKVIGAATMNSLNSIMIINEAIRLNVMPSASTVKSPDFNIQSLLPQINEKKPKCTKCSCMV